MQGASNDYLRQETEALLSAWVDDRYVEGVKSQAVRSEPLATHWLQRLVVWTKNAAAGQVEDLWLSAESLGRQAKRRALVGVAKSANQWIMKKTGGSLRLSLHQDLQGWYQEAMAGARTLSERQVVQLKVLSQIRRNIAPYPEQPNAKRTAARVEWLAGEIMRGVEPLVQKEAEALNHFIQHPLESMMAPKELLSRLFHALPEIQRVLIIDRGHLPQFLNRIGVCFLQDWLLAKRPHDAEEQTSLEQAQRKLLDPETGPLTERELSALVEHLNQQLSTKKTQIVHWLLGTASYLTLHHPELFTHLPAAIRVVIRLEQMGHDAELTRGEVAELDQKIQAIDDSLAKEESQEGQEALLVDKKKLEEEMVRLRSKAVVQEDEAAKREFTMEGRTELIEFMEFALQLFANNCSQVPVAEHAKERDGWSAVVGQAGEALPWARKILKIDGELPRLEELSSKATQEELAARLEKILPPQGMEKEQREVISQAASVLIMHIMEQHSTEILEIAAGVALEAIQHPPEEDFKSWANEQLAKPFALKMIDLLQREQAAVVDLLPKDDALLSTHVESLVSGLKASEWEHRGFLRELIFLVAKNARDNADSPLMDALAKVGRSSLAGEKIALPWEPGEVMKNLVARYGVIFVALSLLVVLIFAVPLAVVLYQRPDWAGKLYGSLVVHSLGKQGENPREEILMDARERLAALARRGVSVKLTAQVNEDIQQEGCDRVAVVAKALQKSSIKMAGIRAEEIEVHLRRTVS